MTIFAIRLAEIALWALTAAYAVPAFAGALDLLSWLLLGGQSTAIEWTDVRMMVAVVCGMVFAPATLCVASAFSAAFAQVSR